MSLFQPRKFFSVAAFRILLRPLLERYKKQAKHVIVTKTVTRCINPKDNMFLALTETVHADYLVSGNIKHLNILVEHEGTPIVTNRQFLADVAPSLLMS